MGILVPWSGIKPVVLAMEVQNPNHWPTGEASLVNLIHILHMHPDVQRSQHKLLGICRSVPEFPSQLWEHPRPRGPGEVTSPPGPWFTQGC